MAAFLCFCVDNKAGDSGRTFILIHDLKPLEAEGMTVTVHGKGTYVAASNTQLMEEERRKEVEADLEAAIQKGRRCGMKEEEIRSLFELIMEDE